MERALLAATPPTRGRSRMPWLAGSAPRFQEHPPTRTHISSSSSSSSSSRGKRGAALQSRTRGRGLPTSQPRWTGLTGGLWRARVGHDHDHDHDGGTQHGDGRALLFRDVRDRGVASSPSLAPPTAVSRTLSRYRISPATSQLSGPPLTPHHSPTRHRHPPAAVWLRRLRSAGGATRCWGCCSSRITRPWVGAGRSRGGRGVGAVAVRGAVRGAVCGRTVCAQQP